MGEDSRYICFRRILENKKDDKNSKWLEFKQKLEPGSLFIMAGDSQKYFTHGVPRDNSKNTRYSLTFRECI